MEKQREVCAVRPLSVSEENSCVQEEIGLFFPYWPFLPMMDNGLILA